MNPLYKKFVGGGVRWLMATAGATAVGAWLVERGILDRVDIEEIIGGIIVALSSLGWSLWSKNRESILTFTMGAMAKGTTMEAANASIALGIQAPAGTGAGDVPVLVNTNTGDVVKPRVDAWLLPLLLAGTLIGGVSVSGCASAGGVVSPNPTVDQVQAARNEGAKLAIVVREAAKLGNESWDTAFASYESKAISTATMQAINSASIKVTTKAREFLVFVGAVTTEANLRTTAAELLKLFDGYIESLKSGGWTGALIQQALATVRAYVGVQ